MSPSPGGHRISWVALLVAILAAILALLTYSCSQSGEDPDPLAGSRRFDRVTFCNHTGAECDVLVQLLKYDPEAENGNPWYTGTPDPQHPEVRGIAFQVEPRQSISRLFSLFENDDPMANVWCVVCTVRQGAKTLKCVLYPDTGVYGENEVHFRSATLWLAPRLSTEGKGLGASLCGHGVMSNDRVGRHMISTTTGGD